MKKSSKKKDPMIIFNTMVDMIMERLTDMEKNHVNFAYYHAHALSKKLEKRMESWKGMIKSNPVSYKGIDGKIYQARVNVSEYTFYNIPQDVKEKYIEIRKRESVSVITE